MKNNFALSRKDIRLLNAYQSVLPTKPEITFKRVPVRKSVLDKELENYKIEKINSVVNAFYTQVSDGTQDFSSKWAVANKALEDVKNAVDLNDFMVYEDFNKLYDIALKALEEYCLSIKNTIKQIDDFQLSVRAIMPQENV